MDDMKTVWGAAVAALVSISLLLPKLLNMRKADSTEGTVLSRVDALEIRAASHDRQIHKYAVTQTRLIVVVTHQNAIIAANGYTISDWLKKEVDALTTLDEGEK